MNKNALLRDTTIKILSVLFAVFLWFHVITEQNPVVPKEITLPVRLVNVESLNKYGLILLDNPSSFSVTLKLKGKKGILDAVNQNTLTAYVDLAGYKTEGETAVPVIINGLPDSVTLTSRSEHVIRVNLDKRIVSQKPVTVNVTGNPIGGMAHIEPVLTPSEVVLTGAESIIDKVKVVRVDVDIAGVGANVNKRLPVKLLDSNGNIVEGIQLDTQHVDVTVPIANTKRVPIQLVLDGTLEEGYTIVSQLVQPKEILVTGKQEALDSLAIIDTVKIKVSKLTQDVTIPLTLDLPEGIQLVNANEQISAQLAIQKIISKTFDISDIEYRNLSDKQMIETLPKNIRVTVRGPEGLINDAEQSLILYVDLSNAKEGAGTYEIHIEKAVGLELLEITPSSIVLEIKSRE